MIVLAFTGGGTGGHIYPGLAVVSVIQKNNPCRIFWIGSDQGMDKKIVEEAGIEFFGIPSGKLRRYFSLKNISDIARITAGFFAARRILKKQKPALLFSKGGFVSVPPAAAAASLGIPVFAHESDFSPGLATRINIRFVKKMFIPYNESLNLYKKKQRSKLEVSGNPVRPVFRSADASRGREFLGIGEAERILLVLGGSSGSVEVNHLIYESLNELTTRCTVVHQTGPNHDENFKTSEKYKPYPYINDELPHIIAASELVICRGGAGTIWECAALGKPMIIIPLKETSSRGDQVENAKLFEEAGAAITFNNDPSDPASSSKKLSETAISLLEDSEKWKKMSMSIISGTNAAQFIAEELIREMEKK